MGACHEKTTCMHSCIELIRQSYGQTAKAKSLKTRLLCTQRSYVSNVYWLVTGWHPTAAAYSYMMWDITACLLILLWWVPPWYFYNIIWCGIFMYLPDIEGRSSIIWYPAGNYLLLYSSVDPSFSSSSCCRVFIAPPPPALLLHHEYTRCTHQFSSSRSSYSILLEIWNPSLTFCRIDSPACHHPTR